MATVSRMCCSGTCTTKRKSTYATSADIFPLSRRCTTRLLFRQVSSVEERLNGRPSLPIAALAAGDNLERFIKNLEDAVDQMVESHKRGSNSSKSALHA